jgi:DNA-binding transcriptional MerR regulator
MRVFSRAKKHLKGNTSCFESYCSKARISNKKEALLNLVPIGRFSQLTGLSVRALRLYDAEGLLQPNTVDAETGYRYYDLKQIPTAERIRSLREVDMPLDDIRVVLHEAKKAKASMEKHRGRLIERATAFKTMIDRLDKIMHDA